MAMKKNKRKNCMEVSTYENQNNSEMIILFTILRVKIEIMQNQQRQHPEHLLFLMISVHILDFVLSFVNMDHLLIIHHNQVIDMKKKIVGELLKLHQTRSLSQLPPQLQQLQQLAYALIADMVTDIKRPFTSVCIHGRRPQFILPFLHEHNAKFGINPTQTRITIVDYIRNTALEELLQAGRVKEVRYVSNADGWLPEEDEFDLLLTALTSHHATSEEDLFGKYLRTLKPDGALIGSSFAEGTLSQLYWSYLLAENERYGGMSPKMLQLPSLGELGNSLTMAKYKLATVVSHEEVWEFESVVDLLTLLQEMGESGYLRGRRKGVYKDLLLSAAALYQTQFGLDNGGVRANLSLSKFIGWKQHQSQPKSLSPGPHVGSVQFSEELRKFGEVQGFVIEEGNDEPRRTK